MSLPDAGNDITNLCGNALTKLLRCKLDPRFHEGSVFFRRQVDVCLQIAQNPALAFCNNMLTELLGCHLVTPFAKRTLGELLNVALVDQRDSLPVVFDRIGNRCPHEPFRSGD